MTRRQEVLLIVVVLTVLWLLLVAFVPGYDPLRGLL